MTESDPKKITEGDAKKITVFLDSGLHRRLSIKKLDSGKSLQELLVAGAELLLQVPGHNPIQPSEIGSPPVLESSRISVNLIRLLESAVHDQDEDALKTVEEYLEFSANRRKRGKSGGQKGGRPVKKA